MAQVFVMACVDVDLSRLAPPESLKHLQGWDVSSRWMHVLATGFSRNSGFTPPSDDQVADNIDAQEGPKRQFSMSSVAYRASRDGLVINPHERLRTAWTRGGDHTAERGEDSYRQSAQSRALTHGRFLDLAMLALRQHQWLDKHAERLAEVYRKPTEDSQTMLGLVLEYEKRINWFHNQRWFRDVPARRDASALLRRLQDRLGTAEDFAELREEQAALRQIALLATEQERLRTDAAAADAKEQELRARQRNREWFELLAALIAPPSLVFGMMAVRFDPGPDAFTMGLSWSIWGMAGAFCIFIVRFLLTRLSRIRRERQAAAQDVNPVEGRPLRIPAEPSPVPSPA